MLECTAAETEIFFLVQMNSKMMWPQTTHLIWSFSPKLEINFTFPEGGDRDWFQICL